MESEGIYHQFAYETMQDNYILSYYNTIEPYACYSPWWQHTQKICSAQAVTDPQDKKRTCQQHVQNIKAEKREEAWACNPISRVSRR